MLLQSANVQTWRNKVAVQLAHIICDIRQPYCPTKVCLTFWIALLQEVHSHHSLRRVSYATCEPAARLMAFLAREPKSPLHLQQCHVFRAESPDQVSMVGLMLFIFIYYWTKYCIFETYSYFHFEQISLCLCYVRSPGEPGLGFNGAQMIYYLILRHV